MNTWKKTFGPNLITQIWKKTENILSYPKQTPLYSLNESDEKKVRILIRGYSDEPG